jgi:hypothetical protein
VIDWKQLTRDIAFKFRSSDRKIWVGMISAMSNDGMSVDESTLRGWAYGRSSPRADCAVWMYLKAKELGIQVRERA